ncbi:hypothetical protein, partial [Tsukamurella soli]
VDDAVARHVAAAARVEQFAAAAEEAAATHAALAVDEAGIAALATELARAKAAVESADHRERLAARDLAARRSLAARHDDARARADRFRAARDRALADRDARAAELAWMTTTVEELGVVAADRRERKAQAQYAFDYAREASRYQRIHDRIEAAEQLEKESAAVRTRLNANVVDRRALQTIAAAERDVEAAQARFTALAATVHLERLGFGDVLVDGRYLAEEPVELTAGDGTVIEVPGAVRIEIRQRGESAAASDRLREAAARVQAACREVGAASPEDARTLHEARLAMEMELQEIRVKLARVTGDDDLAVLRGRLAEAAELMAALEAAVDADELNVDSDTAKQRHLSAVADELQARQELDRATADLEQHRSELHVAETDAQVAAAQLATIDETATDTAAELAADRDRTSDEELAAAADAAADAARAAAQELARRAEA